MYSIAEIKNRLEQLMMIKKNNETTFKYNPDKNHEAVSLYVSVKRRCIRLINQLKKMLKQYEHA